MPLFVNVTPGTTISPTTTLSASTLNLLGTPTVNITGTIDGGTLTIGANSVNTSAIQDLSATPVDLTAAQTKTLLSLVPDETTIETSGTTIRLKDNSVTSAKLSTAPQTSSSTTPTVNVGTSLTWDLTPTGNVAVTLTFGANDDGKTVLVKVKQNAGGTLTATFSASGGKTMQFQAGSAPTLTTGANKADLFVFTCIGSNVYGKQIANFNA